MTANTTYLVTGTAGFIGFHTAKALLGQGHRVVGFDNFNDYYDVRIKRARSALLRENPEYVEYEADLADYDSLKKVFSSHSPSLVCHLAAQAGVRYSLDHPMAYERSNLAGFINVLELCRHHKVRRLVYASSSSVYGNNTKLPFSESDPVETPISLYAATKRANELMAHAYCHLFGLQVAGLRFFTVYGPWGRPDMAIWQFARALLDGQPISLFNHGQMERDFTFIDDIVSGVISALQVSGLPQYSLINLGNHHPEHLMALIELLEQQTGRKAQLELLPMQPGDVPRTFADVTVARELLGFEPHTHIDQGIPEFMRWFTTHSELTMGRRLDSSA